MKYDLIIKGGNIIDGSGSEPYVADVAIKDGKIARIAENISAEGEIIDARGLTITPGFIDSHSHSDSTILSYPDQLEKIEQGITTSIGGQCGSSVAPLPCDFNEKDDVDIGTYGKKSIVYKSMGSFLDVAKNVPIGSNTASFVGHRALRLAAVGPGSEKPTEEQLEKMKELLREGMEHGAMGVSYGLIYSPSCYAKTEELIALARVAKECGGIVSAHIRNEGDSVEEAVAEFIEILEKSGARGVLSHHKSSGHKNWGKVKNTIPMMLAARARGVDIYCDVYPYVASSTSLSATFIPKAMRACNSAELVKKLADESFCAEIKAARVAKGAPTDLSYVLVTVAKNNERFQGMYLSEIADELGIDHLDAALKIIRESGNATSACYFTMCEEDVETVIAYENAMICTDSGVAAGKTVFHPRLRASFPRAIGKYVRERGVVTLPEMIRKMTSLPAYVYGLKTKGVIKEGYDADICIFNYERFIDRASFTEPTLKCQGLEYVLVGGNVVVRDAVHNGKRCGRVYLRKEAIAD